MGAEALNITIASYIMFSPNILASTRYLGATFDMGRNFLKQRYGYDSTVNYIGNTSSANTNQMLENLYLLYKFYYQSRNQNNLLVFICPGNDELLEEGLLAKELDVLLLSTTASYTGFRNRDKYPTTISPASMQYGTFADVFATFFQYFSWRTITIIKDLSGLKPFYDSTLEAAEARLRQDRLTFVTLTLGSRFNRTADSAVQQALQTAASRSRVILLAIIANHTRRYMLMASQLNMTNGDFVFIFFEPFTSYRFFGSLVWSLPSDAENDETAAKAFRSMFRIYMCESEVSAKNSHVLTEMSQRMKDDYDVAWHPPGEPMSGVATANYGSFDMLGQVLNETRANWPDNVPFTPSGADLASRFLNQTFSLELEDVYINTLGERRSNYCVQDFDYAKKIFRSVILIDTINERAHLIPDSTIDWNNAANQGPPNRPLCGYVNDGTWCREGNVYTDLLPGVTTLIVLLLVMVFGAWVYTREKFMRERMALLWLPSDELIEFKARRESAWKISRMRLHRMAVAISENTTFPVSPYYNQICAFESFRK